MKKIALFLTVFICFFLPEHGWGKVVTAKGLSFFEPGRELIAKEKAMDEARRAAVEKAFGASIESRTAVEDFQVVKDQILSRTKGYLKNIKVLDEKKSELGTYEVTIQADVEISALVNDMDRFKKKSGWQKNPRISVIIGPGVNKDFFPTAKLANGLIIEKLKQNGFKVFKYTKDNQYRMGLLAELSLDLFTRRTKYQDIELALNEISLNVNIYKPGDGEILATAGAVKSLPGENKLQVLDKGTRICVDKIWRKLRKKLIRVWEKELYSKRDIDLTVTGVSSHAEAENIRTAFKSDIRGILDTDLMVFVKGKAEYSLKYRGWPEQFLNEIEMSYFKNKYFDSEMESFSGNKIIIKKISVLKKP